MTLPPNGPSPYYAFEYAQPFQPLGQPMGSAPPPPYGSSSPWNAPMSPTYPVNVPPRGPPVQFVVGSPQGGLQRSQSQSFNASYGASYPNGKMEQRNRHGRSHSTRKRSRYDLQQSYSVSGPIAFPEPQIYPPTNFGPPPPYPGSPPFSGNPGVSAGPLIPREPEYGMSGDEISIQPEHCTFLVDAVKEMDLCSRIFSTWVQQLDSAEVGKSKEEANIVSMITGLADDAVKMLTASRNILSSYKALARLMDRRLTTLSRSSQGGDLFSPSHSSPHAQSRDDFQKLALDVHVHSVEIGACVEQMQERLHGLHDTVLRTHEKYSFRKKFWGWVCCVFRVIASGLFIGGTITSFTNPAGIVGNAVMQVGSGLASIVASVCEKIKEAYGDEEKGLSEVLKLLQGKIPHSMRVAQTALEKFQAAHIVFRQHHRVAEGRASGYISPGEAARARNNWHKAANLLELKDTTTPLLG